MWPPPCSVRTTRLCNQHVNTLLETIAQDYARSVTTRSQDRSKAQVGNGSSTASSDTAHGSNATRSGANLQQNIANGASAINTNNPGPGRNEPRRNPRRNNVTSSDTASEPETTMSILETRSNDPTPAQWHAVLLKSVTQWSLHCRGWWRKRRKSEILYTLAKTTDESWSSGRGIARLFVQSRGP
ncbi:hypothetical protein B0H10DRAFT_1295476 [Mycena sp. CBHHK59/15]|nr:hypothetical protein B0H10DRAFT_1295476 [Mycena sp. CBHHK59/15]